MEVYIVRHVFDSNRGDAIGEEVLCGFMNKVEAEAFVSAYANPHVYGRAYGDDLMCGELVIEELTMIPPSVDKMWWLREEES